MRRVSFNHNAHDVFRIIAVSYYLGTVYSRRSVLTGEKIMHETQMSGWKVMWSQLICITKNKTGMIVLK